MTTNATVEARHKEQAAKAAKYPDWEDFSRDNFRDEPEYESVLAHAQALANLEAARAENADLTNRLAEINPAPWANFHGDLPDYDHPLRPVYESGIQYAVNLLAKVLEVTDYEPCDGTEEFDGDLGGTMGNIVLAAMPKDEHGDPIWPKDLHTPSPCPHCSEKDEAMEAFKAEVSEVVTELLSWPSEDKPFLRSRLERFIIPPADPLAEALKAAVQEAWDDPIPTEESTVDVITRGLMTNLAKHGLELSRLGGAK